MKRLQGGGYAALSPATQHRRDAAQFLLSLTLGFFGFFFFRIYRRGDASLKENVILILTLIFSFGMRHRLLVIDRHVVLYTLYFLLLTTGSHGWRPSYNQEDLKTLICRWCQIPNTIPPHRQPGEMRLVVRAKGLLHAGLK